jgi:hypothetical protein
MKLMKNKIFVIISCLAGLCLLLNSCLKDDADYWKEDVAGKMYATVLKPTLQTMSLDPVADTVSFSFLVNIATDQPPTSAVTLTLDVDPDAVTAYNERTGKAFLAYPTVLIVNPSVTIAAGTRTATVNCKVWGADALNACDNFIAAVTIVSVSDPNIKIASNMKSYLLSLPISNPYAADYHCVGYRLHPTAGYGGIDATQTLSTIDCKTVTKSGVGNYGSYDAKIEVTTDVITVAGTDCYKVNITVVDPSTGTDVAGGQYTTFNGDNTKPPVPATNDVNYYNPVTKTFVLNYYYNTAAPRIIYEVLTRL